MVVMTRRSVYGFATFKAASIATAEATQLRRRVAPIESLHLWTAD